MQNSGPVLVGTVFRNLTRLSNIPEEHNVCGISKKNILCARRNKTKTFSCPNFILSLGLWRLTAKQGI